MAPCRRPQDRQLMVVLVEGLLMDYLAKLSPCIAVLLFVLLLMGVVVDDTLVFEVTVVAGMFLAALEFLFALPERRKRLAHWKFIFAMHMLRRQTEHGPLDPILVDLNGYLREHPEATIQDWANTRKSARSQLSPKA